MGANTIAEVSGSITYEINNKTTKNLDKFQKRLANVQRQMKGLNASIKINASVSERANKKVVTSAKKAARQTAAIEKSSGVASLLGSSKSQQTMNKMKYGTGKEAIKNADKVAKKEAEIADRIKVKDYVMKNNLKTLRKTGKITEEQQRSQLTQLAQINKLYQRGTISVKMYNAQIQKLNKDTRRLANGNKSLFSKLSSVRGLMASGVILGAAGGARNIAETGMGFQDLTASLVMVTGNLAEARKEMDYVKATANKLGISSETAAEGFVKLAVAGKESMKMKDVKELFEGFSMFSTAAGANAFRQSKGLNALVQMMSKGKIQAEEFRGQLAEQIAGAGGVFYKAAGMTPAEFNKAMENGKLVPSELLPKVAKEFKKAANQGGAFDEMLKNSSKRLQLFQNAAADWKDEIFKGGFGDALNWVFDGFAKILANTKPLARAIGSVLKGAMTTLTIPMKALGNILEVIAMTLDEMGIKSISLDGTFTKLVGAIVGVTSAIKLLGNTALASWAKVLLPITAVILGLEELHAAFSDKKFGVFDAARGGALDSLTNNKATTIQDEAWYRTAMRFTPLEAINTISGISSRIVDVNVNVNDSELKNVITATVDEREQQNAISTTEFAPQ